jgi:hypothetical protein
LTRALYTYFLNTTAQQASLAQLVERGTSNAEVTGSTPLGGISFCCFDCTMSIEQDCRTLMPMGVFFFWWKRVADMHKTWRGSCA